MKRFDELGLAETLLATLKAQGYETPTPIQSKAIPALLGDEDVLGIAQTGTGKTAAFVLPILDRIAGHRGWNEPRTAAALILTPTRELANQIADTIRQLGRKVRPSVALVVGGVRPGPQIKALAGGVDIIVATPGRLLDHLGTGAVRLDATEMLVLDEADQMLDMGFIPAVRRIAGMLPENRQTAMLSATMSPKMRALAGEFLNHPVEIAVTPAATPISEIAQSVIMIGRSDKRDALVNYLGGAGVDRTIVFTRTKRGADRVELHLSRAGLRSKAIHGNKSQGQREAALAAFKTGKCDVLVATDIAARGIDVTDVSHVVNFDLPEVPESYVHRIGRTARAGKSGTAVSFCDPSERRLLRDIERLIGMKIDAGKQEPRAARQERPAPGIDAEMPVTEERAAAGRDSAPEGRDRRASPWRKTEGEAADRNGGPRKPRQGPRKHGGPKTPGQKQTAGKHAGQKHASRKGRRRAAA